MKKTLLIFLMLLLLLTGCKKKDNNTNKKVEDVKWEVVEDEKINDKPYKTYSTSEYSEGYVKGIYNGTTYKFIYPSDVKLSGADFYSTSYNGSMQITIVEEDIEEEIDDYLDYLYEINKNNNYNTTVKTKKISNDLFIARVSNMTFNDGTTFYLDHLKVYLRDSEEAFIVIDYLLFKEKFDDKLINKLVNSISKEKNDYNFNNCKEKNGKYECSYLNVDNKTINFTVNKKAFAMAANERPDNYYNSFASTSVIGEDDYEARVGALYLDGGDFYGSVDTLLSEYEKSKTKVNVDGKEFVKYYLTEEVDEEEIEEGMEPYTTAYYVYKISDYVGIYINIDSSKDTDKVLEYFTDITVKEA